MPASSATSFSRATISNFFWLLGISGSNVVRQRLRRPVVMSIEDGSVYRPAPLRVGNARGKMWTTDELLTDRAVHADLRSRGVVSLDMETAAIAKVCDQRGVAWSVVRAISDRAGDGSVDAEIAGLTHSDGTANRAAVARYLVRHRNALPRLARLAKGANLAAGQAANAAIMAVSRSVNS